MIKKYIERELYSAEKNAIEKYLYYTDKTAWVVCLKKGVGIILKKDSYKTVEEVYKRAKDLIGATLNSHSGFNGYIMDDGYGLCEMHTGVLPVSDEKLTNDDIKENEFDEKSIVMKRAMWLREKCLEACFDETIVAIVKEDSVKVKSLSSEQRHNKKALQ